MSDPATPLPGPSTKDEAAAAGGGGGGGAGAPPPYVSYEGTKNKEGQRHGDKGACGGGGRVCVGVGVHVYYGHGKT